MFIIAIAGGSGSGKTSVAERLLEAVNQTHHEATILCEDSYYHSLTEEQLANLDDVNFDHPDAINHAQLRKDLIDLKNGKTIDAPNYCYKTHQQLTETRPQAPVDVLIIEGLHLLHRQALQPLYDQTVFVDTPTPIRLQRRMTRDIIERQRTEESVLAQFNKTVQPCHELYVQPSKQQADYVVDGTLPLEEIMPALIARILHKLGYQ